MFFADVEFEFVAEFAEVASQGHRGAVGQRTNRGPAHVIADIEQAIDVIRPAAAFPDPP